MAEITPTPRAGHWITVDGVTVSEAAPRAGHWIRVDSLPTFRRPRTSVGILVVGAGVSSS